MDRRSTYLEPRHLPLRRRPCRLRRYPRRPCRQLPYHPRPIRYHRHRCLPHQRPPRSSLREVHPQSKRCLRCHHHPRKSRNLQSAARALSNQFVTLKSSEPPRNFGGPGPCGEGMLVSVPRTVYRRATFCAPGQRRMSWIRALPVLKGSTREKSRERAEVSRPRSFLHARHL